ncbi:hypothetical protein [Clavibacter nebraskensis]|uniref:Integral membrane protein n=2 Tax=Clavibacter nebraskensis TaxID=31963 RepID=A0A399Q4P2_9MICO|nr:hypothetical protein [Clavibacter nebraskensis]KXU22001.1 hypothetical protein VV38_01410 [Clavibacter nebraskensis]OAH18741.1 hypothetical protein A3Q38_09830 [Clavibacter nebraskensis]QGV65681.1 hypothetical protein EGX36_01770 [Clavibacter nebraskensis]QGV68477.1 hypothetical protein EGX37_01755 [Clavibacter nebraskensis]QGV71268.1 hypothetical protein EGX35_01755 [Clavibacter nebraskensis]
MTALKHYGWLIPTLLAIGLAAVTDMSPWLLGAMAAAVILAGYAVAWVLGRQARSARDSQSAHRR